MVVRVGKVRVEGVGEGESWHRVQLQALCMYKRVRLRGEGVG